MLRLVIIILVIAVALLRGGSLRNLNDLKLRWLPLVIASFGLQLLIFTPFAKAPLIAVATVPLYILSMALLTIWVAANWQIHGVVLIAIGLLMNFAAIMVNDGHMPVSSERARYAGTIAEFATGGARIANNSIATDDQVRLWILTDIIPLPQGLPFANVFSIGDVLLTIGVGVLCYRTIHRPPDVNRVG